ncbi:MAG: hypothetical protein WD850_00685 [Candidatus Spechtbacterales bacterium]
MLDVSRMEDGTFGFAAKDQARVPVVEKVCASFEQAAKRKKIWFSVDTPPEEDIVTFDADKRPLQLKT